MRPRGRRIATVLLALVGAVMVCGAGLVLLILALLPKTGINFGFTSHRPKPIAVSPRVCPYLRAVHTTGETAATSSMDLFVGQPAPAAKVGYPDPYAAQLAAFDLSLRVAAAEVPARLRRKLNEVAANVEADIQLLRKTPNRDDYASHFTNALFDGANAYFYASDLVGEQCGFTLADFPA